ncbi:MAG: STAS domain-containing protein [Sphingomonadales bacterium]|nr:STAS domain-containing protein [Sphingomonadales bacterium]
MIENIGLVDDVFEVRIVDRLTFADHEEFRKVLKRISEGGFKSIVFDLQNLEFIDSAGLGMFLLAKDEADSRGQSVTLKGANGNIKKMLNVAQFDTLFKIC